MNWRRAGSATRSPCGAWRWAGPLGGTLAGLVGVFLTPALEWQVLYWVGALSIPLTLLMHRALPESPKFLALTGRQDELRRLLTRLRPERAAAYANAGLHTRQAPAVGNPVLALLAPRYRRTSLTIWVTSFLSLFCIFGLTGWIPTVMMKRGETFAASFGFGALMQVMSFVGGLVLAMLADRRPAASTRLLSLWWGLGGLSVIALIFLGGHGVNFVCVAAAGFLTIGAQHVLNNFTAASYDTGIRASGVGMELGVGRGRRHPGTAGRRDAARRDRRVGGDVLDYRRCRAGGGGMHRPPWAQGASPVLVGEGLLAEAEHA